MYTVGVGLEGSQRNGERTDLVESFVFGAGRGNSLKIGEKPSRVRVFK